MAVMSDGEGRVTEDLWQGDVTRNAPSAVTMQKVVGTRSQASPVPFSTPHSHTPQVPAPPAHLHEK